MYRAKKWPVYRTIASAVAQWNHFVKRGQQDEANNLEDDLEKFIYDNLPRGSGLDDGVKIDLATSIPNRIVLNTAFHHMNENGYYERWTKHNVIVTADMTGMIDVKITGRDYKDIKEYLGNIFYLALTGVIPTYEIEVTLNRVYRDSSEAFILKSERNYNSADEYIMFLKDTLIPDMLESNNGEISGMIETLLEAVYWLDVYRI